jgi:DNA-binding transcriptional ArsR family regulator
MLLHLAPASRKSHFVLDKAQLLYNHMVVQSNGYAMTASQRLDSTFAALADPTRRAILARLALGEASVLELAKPFAMSQPAVSKHLKVLERAGLVSRGRQAQRRPRRLVAKPLADAADWLERYREIWEANFQRLDALLDEMKLAQTRPKRSPRKGESR